MGLAISRTTGPGLALVHRIVADHGGIVTVSSPAGGGAEFVVKIPRAGVDSPTPQYRDRLHPPL